MFLALREIRHAKVRFLAICAVVFLLSYVVYFLTGLAYGLASSYTEVLTRWNAQSITLTEESNANALASRMDAAQLEYDPSSSALWQVTATAVPALDNSTDARVNVYLFATDVDSFLIPEPSSGTAPASPSQVLADSTLQRSGYHVGSSLSIPHISTPVTISGFVDHARFQAAPVIFLSPALFSQAAQLPSGTRLVNAVVSTDENAAVQYHGNDAHLVTLSTKKFIDELPGYRAQYLTFGLMIGALIAILSLVLGIFMYVLTLQKKHVFGVMKAQGIPTSYLARSGAIHTLLITVVGVGLGLLAAVASGIALSSKVPFAVNPLLFTAVSIAFIVFTLIGSIFPISIISRVDPLEAMNA
ncbi:ABC transporter permease [Trueperella sp. LYQ143]|uniref:ABC transporter permease n=1 Tax=unclassified Trueperella TaxID=2630174 RepID=UPI00398317AF